MQRLLRVLAVSLTATTLAVAAAAPADGPSVIAVSESAIMHLDSSGALLAWRPEVSQWWQAWHVTTNPRNGTVCWVSSPEDQSVAGVLRCAPITNLNQTWDLPQPRGFSVSKVDAIAFDWVEENWYLAVSRTNYVCSYVFDRCAKLGESVGKMRFFAAYDIPNRLLFRINTEKSLPYKLEVVNLDGSGRRELPTVLAYPTGMAVDPVSRQIFILDEENLLRAGLYKLDYNGEGKELLTQLDVQGFDISWRCSLDVFDGEGVVMYNDQKTISAFSVVGGRKTTLVNGTVKGETLPELAKVEKLLAVKIFSPVTSPEVENPCRDAACSDLCIPMLVDGTARASCLCPEGERLVDLACHVDYPLYAVVSGGDKLQAVDMHTGTVTTILNDLTNVSRVDFFWTGGEEFFLYWVDAGSLFVGRWLSSGPVSEVQTLVKASETRKVLEVVVDWVHRHLICMERDPTQSQYSKQLNISLSPLDGSYHKTIANDYWNDKRAMFVFNLGQYFGYAQKDWGRVRIVTRNSTGSPSWSSIGIYGEKFFTSLPNEVAVDLSLAGVAWQERFFWVSADDQAIDYVSKSGLASKVTRSRLLTHPSLADAGGLDVLDSRLYWTERSTGQLWTAVSHTGGDVRALPITTAGGSLRLLHPWRHPLPPADEMCDEERNGCSHFCLTDLTVQKPVRHCVCPDGTELGVDGKTCWPM